MPTDREIEAAAKALVGHDHGGGDYGMTPDDIWNTLRARVDYKSRAHLALLAAEKVRMEDEK